VNGHGRDISRPAEILLDAEGVIRWERFTDNFRVRPRPDEALAAAKQLR
jgi:peroxiredoxin